MATVKLLPCPSQIINTITPARKNKAFLPSA